MAGGRDLTCLRRSPITHLEPFEELRNLFEIEIQSPPSVQELDPVLESHQDRYMVHLQDRDYCDIHISLGDFLAGKSDTASGRILVVSIELVSR